MLIVLIYAKSLFAVDEFVGCFELLQHQFAQNPHMVVFLYLYSKYVAKSK